ncbi:transposase [Candidatus Uhrbacteria bacterium]|nr:transposase [Candidatus Uhrbacteria bacterium]
MGHVREKSHHLPLSCYIGRHPIAFTCCVENRNDCFRDRSTVGAIKSLLQKCLQKFNIDAHVYLFMPDHCHLLLEGQDDAADMYTCMHTFKQQSGFWLAKNKQMHWQKNFYDHILRKEEDIEKHVRYILNNPVRQDIVEDWKQYPYKGSTLYDLSKW